MVNDFLHAWLVEGDVVAAMGYVSQRAYASLAQDAADPSEFDRGMAPYQLMVNLKAAHQAVVGTHHSLDGLTVGVRLATPALKVVRQPQHSQFVVYSVPDHAAQYRERVRHDAALSDRGRDPPRAAVAVAQTGECVADNQLRRRAPVKGRACPRRDRGLPSAGGFAHRTLLSDGGRVKGHRR